MLTDPGAVPRGNATKENIQRMGFEEGQVGVCVCVCVCVFVKSESGKMKRVWSCYIV